MFAADLFLAGVIVTGSNRRYLKIRERGRMKHNVYRLTLLDLPKHPLKVFIAIKVAGSRMPKLREPPENKSDLMPPVPKSFRQYYAQLDSGTVRDQANLVNALAAWSSSNDHVH